MTCSHEHSCDCRVSLKFTTFLLRGKMTAVKQHYSDIAAAAPELRQKLAHFINGTAPIPSTNSAKCIDTLDQQLPLTTLALI